jgi:hypothetical protein
MIMTRIIHSSHNLRDLTNAAAAGLGIGLTVGVIFRCQNRLKPTPFSASALRVPPVSLNAWMIPSL